MWLGGNYMKQREIYKTLIFEPAKTRIKNNQCPSCGLPKSKWNRRTDWRCCSVKCTEKFQKMYVTYSWQELRMKAIKRDNFTCAICGTQPIKILENRNMNNNEFEEYARKYYEIVCYFKKEIDGKKRLQAVIFDDSKLIGDHIKPISLGGDEFDLKNIQTLCVDCNKRKTKRDQINIAVARNLEKIQSKGQKQL